MVQQEKQKEKGSKTFSFQPTTPDTEDPELERMVSRARLTTTALFYDRDKNEGLTEIGPTTQPAVKEGSKTQMKGQTKTESNKRKSAIVTGIPQWSKKSLRQHARKVKENLTLLQQGKEKEADVFIRNNTKQRDGRSIVGGMLQEHLQKIANITLQQTPSKAMELLEAEPQNSEKEKTQDHMKEEPTMSQIEEIRGKRCQAMPEVDVQTV